MNGVAHAGAAALQFVGQLAHLVLCLGKGHAVARHDNHVLGFRQHACCGGLLFLSGRFLLFGFVNLLVEHFHAAFQILHNLLQLLYLFL